MHLLAALIKQIDMPGSAAQISFEIKNGDARSMMQMLNNIVPAGSPTAGPGRCGRGILARAAAVLRRPADQ